LTDQVEGSFVKQAFGISWSDTKEGRFRVAIAAFALALALSAIALFSPASAGPLSSFSHKSTGGATLALDISSLSVVRGAVTITVDGNSWSGSTDGNSWSGSTDGNSWS
jgi:hypothetical protein